jgi:hypothetical protein
MKSKRRGKKEVGNLCHKKNRVPFQAGWEKVSHDHMKMIPYRLANKPYHVKMIADRLTINTYHEKMTPDHQVSNPYQMKMIPFHQKYKTYQKKVLAYRQEVMPNRNKRGPNRQIVTKDCK